MSLNINEILSLASKFEKDASFEEDNKLDFDELPELEASMKIAEMLSLALRSKNKIF